MGSLRGAAPSYSGRRRRSNGTTMSDLSDTVVHQHPKLPHEIRPNHALGVVALRLQGSDNLFGRPALPGAGEIKSAFEWGRVRARHVVVSGSPRYPSSTLQFQRAFPLTKLASVIRRTTPR
jgi:hypothetical protein